MPKVYFQDQTYTLEQIQGLENAHTPELILIQKWLSGDQKFCFMSSGSTGQPKTIRATRQQLSSSAQRTLSHLNISGGMVLNQLSARHIGGAMQVIRALVGGLDLVLIAPDSKNLENLAVDWRQVVLFSLVPHQLDRLMKTNPKEIQTIQNILLGGAPLNPQLKHQIEQANLSNLYETYGMTETLSHIALKKTVDQPHFCVLEGVEIRTDERNCLVINDTKLGIKQLITNDLVELITPKTFKWLGRFDHVINSGGLKHVVEVLENKLSSLIPHHAYLIYALPHQTLGQTIHLLVESKEEIEKLTTKAHYLALLDPYEVPKTVAFVPSLKRTPTNKIKRDASLTQIGKTLPIR